MTKGRILIIDDDVSQLELLTLFLCSRGHEVKCSSTAVEGLALNEAFHPDIIILDVRLPDIEGLEVLKELSRRNLNCRMIMITAYHDMETRIGAMKLGACDYVTKPIDLDELERAVDQAVCV